MRIFVIDMSHHEWASGINLAKVKAAGFDAIYFKLTEGVDWTDPKVEAFIDLVIGSGLKVGFYHFATPGGSVVSSGYKKWWDPEDEAHDFLEALARPKFKNYDLRPALDLEWREEHLKAVGMANNPEKMTQWCVEWITEVRKELGYYPLFYTYVHYMSNLDLPNSVLKKCNLWLAHYTWSPDKAPDFDPDWGWDTWCMHQYHDKLTVNGLPKGVDANVAPSGMGPLLVPAGGDKDAQIRERLKVIRESCDAIEEMLED